MKSTSVDISTKSIIKIIALILALWFLWVVRDIIVLFLVVLIFVATFGPIVDWLGKYKFPRIVSVLLIFIFFLGLLSLIGYLIIPPLANQIRELANNFPAYWTRFTGYFESVQRAYNQNLPHTSSQSLFSVSDQISKLSSNIFSSTIGFFGGLVGVITAFVLTFYLLLDEVSIKHLIISFIPERHQARSAKITHQISEKWGAWMRGQFVVSLTIGIIDMIGMMIIGVPFALTLGIWAAFTELIPILGPVLGAIPAILIALSGSLWKAVIVTIFYILVQQLEGHILVPKIMQKSVGLSPVIIILAILVGGKIDGLLGIILAIPLAAGVFVLIEEWSRYRKTNQ